MKTQVRQYLNELQIAMRLHQVWESVPPSAEALANTEPFCVSTLSATQWLQWIFLPRMNALLDANSELPKNFAITPYLEEALKNEEYLAALCTPIAELEKLLKA
ncbi:anhydro-N-acetylmuramic acid kinase [Pasteurellaceae bacterium 15-036681]|nr:anhydro-N-acetylmuramic acid kinase [Pasteurellaceae bacterium 15-036681]